MNMKRMRGRNHRPNGGGNGGTGGGFRNQQNGIPLNRNHVFDSSGPEMRLRGTAQQLHEKYTQLARDASSSGDRVTGEAYYQHAEHYFRIISAINQASGQPNGQPAQNGNYQQNGQDRNQNGYQNNNGGDYNRRTEPNAGDVSTEPQSETRAEPRQQEQPRRFEPRPYEPRNRPEFARTDRSPRQDTRTEVQTETPAVDTRIDISSALEAELAAATAAPSVTAAEPRAIPISTSPPEDVVVARPRPRGRPRTVKAEVQE